MDEHEEEQVLTPIYGYRMLIYIICTALYVFLISVMTVIDWNQMTLDEASAASSGLFWSLVAAAVFVLAEVAMISIGGFLVLFFPQRLSKRRTEGLTNKVVAVLGFLRLASVVSCTCAVVFATNHPIVCGVLSFIAGIISYFPEAVTWNISDETRIKNFMDALARTCTCLTFIFGGIALLLNLIAQAK